MVTRTGTAVAALFGLALLSAPARATVLFSQLPVAGAPGWTSDFDKGQQIADNFSLGAGATIKHIRWWGAYLDGGIAAGDDFVARFFDDSAGTPFTGPFQTSALTNFSRTATGLLDDFLRIIHRYEADLATPVAVSAATTYYLSMVNDTPGDFGWKWSTTGSNASRFSRVADGNAWSSNSFGDQAFELDDQFAAVVPEPGSLALLGLGLLGLVRRRTRA